MTEADQHLIHWALIRQRESLGAISTAVDAPFVEDQAYACPHYVPLQGPLGADWGVIVHPQSKKFGQLVFEHESCGCGYHHATYPAEPDAS